MKTVLLLLVMGQLAQASGWRCTSQDKSLGLSVKLYNYTAPYMGTTNPAQFIVSENEETIVHRFGNHIDFLSTQKGTTYRTTDSKNSYGCVIGFHIGFREGVDSISHGSRRTGRLFLSSCEDPEEEVEYRLSCKRYLKNPE